MATASANIDTIEIPSGKEWSQTLVKELGVMPDENKLWTLDKILLAPDSLFSHKMAYKRPTYLTYWSKVILANHGNQDESLSITSNFWDFVTVYIHDSTGLIRTLNFGLLNKNSGFQFMVPKQSIVLVLAKFESKGQFRRETNINLILRKSASGVQRIEFRNYMDGILLGIILGLAFYNLFLFISLRDMAYFWYTGYIFFLVLNFITFAMNAPSKLELHFFPTRPYLAFFLFNVSVPALNIIYIQFTRQFLQSKIRYPSWDLLLRVMMGLLLLQFLITLFKIHQFRGSDRIWLMILFSLISLVVAIKSYLKGYEKAKFFFLGQLFVLLGHTIALTYLLKPDLFSFFPNNEFNFYFLTPKAFWTGAAFEAMLFSLALANKYNLFQRDITRVTIEKEQEKQVMLTSQIYQLRENARTSNENLVLKQKASELEMQALRAQMNPHFIFNTLNSINNFILKNDKLQASDYLIKFSKLVRLILENSTLTLISLDQELEALKLYIELEALRFHHRFEYQIIFSKDLDITSIKVPPLILQPFVENAIHHGLMPKEGPGHLKITITEMESKLLLKIEDDGIGRHKSAMNNANTSHKHKSLGLEVTTERIGFLNKQHTDNSKVEINDLTDEKGKALGTEISINIPVII